MAGRSGLTLKPCWRTQAVTAGPPPLTTVMVRASTWVRRSTRAGLATVDAACAAPLKASGAGGGTSSSRRSTVQLPPRVTDVGTPGRGLSEPNLVPPAAYSQEVT